MSLAQASETDVTPLVSLRFCALVMGMNYGACTAVMRKAQIGRAQGALRDWAEVHRKLGRYIIGARAIRILLKYVKPDQQGVEHIEIHKSDLQKLRVAWRKLGRDGQCDMVAEAPPLPRGPKPKQIVEEEEDEPEDNTPTAMERMATAKLHAAEEELRFRKMQTNRMAGLMCDRNTVKSGAAAAALVIQRHVRSMPSRVTGLLVKFATLSDGELRRIEKALEDETPVLIEELKRELAEAEQDAVKLAASQRYGDRNWSAEAASTEALVEP